MTLPGEITYDNGHLKQKVPLEIKNAINIIENKKEYIQIDIYIYQKLIILTFDLRKGG